MALALDGSAHNNASASSVNVTLTTSNSNNLIFVIVTSNETPVTSISDVDGLTWNFIVAGGNGTDKEIEMWYAVAASPLSSDVITVNLNASGFTTVDAFGVSGADTTSPFDVHASTPASVDDSSNIVLSTTADDTFIVGGYRYSATASPTEGTGFTKISGADYQLTQYKIVSSAQTNLTFAEGGDNRNGGVATAVVISTGGPEPTLSTGTLSLMGAGK